MAVVVGYIPTDVGYTALDAAVQEVQRRGGPLIVVNVARAGSEDDPRFAQPSELEAAREEARRLQARVDVRQETIADDSDFADVLLRIVDEEKAELLVIGARHRRERVGAHLLGRTVEKLLLSAPCEVLLV